MDYKAYWQMEWQSNKNRNCNEVKLDKSVIQQAGANEEHRISPKNWSVWGQLSIYS